MNRFEYSLNVIYGIIRTFLFHKMCGPDKPATSILQGICGSARFQPGKAGVKLLGKRTFCEAGRLRNKVILQKGSFTKHLKQA